MQIPDDPNETLPAGWEQVLDEIQHALGENLAVVEARMPESDKPEASRMKFDPDRLGQRLDKLQLCLERAERHAADVDSALVAEQALARRQLQAIVELQQRLAKWESASI